MFTAEVLDQPLRELIKSIFHAELMDIYAATETGFMAAECSSCIDGRFMDSVILPNGRIVHPFHLTQVLGEVPYIFKFQIRQEAPNYVRVLLVKDTAKEADGISFTRETANLDNLFSSDSSRSLMVK